MTTEIARQEQPRHLAAVSATPAIDGFKLLDIYSGGVSDEAPRVESIATISAGYRGRGEGNRPGTPQRSSDGTIYVHDAAGRAPGLKRALEQTGKKRLTIAFPFDDPVRFIHCRFMSYTASELQAFGDETHLMVLVPGRGYARVDAGTQAYGQWLAKCKVSVSVYFCLSEWGADGPEIVFPDGVGAYYRLRFTSRHSLRSILAGLRSIGQFTQGRIAGVPFDLTIDYREVAGPDGKKRTIPVWSIASRPPGGRRLTSRNFNEVMTLALEQGAALMLPAPTEPTLEEALAEGPYDDLDESVVEGVAVGEPSDREIELIQRGGRCNAEHFRALWFAAVRGTVLDGDDSPNRATWLREYTKGKHDSLADALHWMTEREATAMVVAADDWLKQQMANRPAPAPARTASNEKARRSYQDLFPDDEEPAASSTPPSEPVEASDSEPEPSEAQRIIAAAIADPASFARQRADDWYARLVEIAAEHEHPQAKKVQAKHASELDYAVLVGSIRVMLGWFPDVTVEQLDNVDGDPT